MYIADRMTDPADSTSLMERQLKGESRISQRCGNVGVTQIDPLRALMETPSRPHLNLEGSLSLSLFFSPALYIYTVQKKKKKFENNKNFYFLHFFTSISASAGLIIHIASTYVFVASYTRVCRAYSIVVVLRILRDSKIQDPLSTNSF